VDREIKISKSKAGKIRSDKKINLDLILKNRESYLMRIQRPNPWYWGIY
jgi:hypothetical protein